MMYEIVIGGAKHITRAFDFGRATRHGRTWVKVDHDNTIGTICSMTHSEWGEVHRKVLASLTLKLAILSCGWHPYPALFRQPKFAPFQLC